MFSQRFHACLKLLLVCVHLLLGFGLGALQVRLFLTQHSVMNVKLPLGYESFFFLLSAGEVIDCLLNVPVV